MHLQVLGEALCISEADRAGFRAVWRRNQKNVRKKERAEEETGCYERSRRLFKAVQQDGFFIFYGSRPMTQAGFELCVEEMIQLNYTSLYSAFSEKYPEMLEHFNLQADELEKRGREAGLPEAVKQQMWDRILENIGEK